MEAIAAPVGQGRSVAIFPWGDVIEAFLEPLGLDLGAFVRDMTGGWLFGYVLALQSQGWRPVVVCASEAVDRLTRFEHAGTGAPIWVAPGKRSGQGLTRHVPSAQSVQHWLRSPWRDFKTVLDQERCRILLVQEYEYARFDLLAWLADRTGRSIFATFQGGDVTLSAIEGLARGWSLAHASGLIVASASERARLAGAYRRLPLPIADIPNPLDTNEWQAEPRLAARGALGLAADALVVINHGRTDIRRKGLDVLVDAWMTFSPSRPLAQLVLIGSGQDHAAFTELLAARAPERLTWISDYVTDRPTVRRWLSAADIYVTASRTEGMPVAPLEAMACGLPVVSTDAQGLPDIFADGESHGGIVVRRDDVDAIVHALDRLADPDLRLRLGRAARARAEERFSIAAVGEALSEFMLKGVDGSVVR